MAPVGRRHRPTKYVETTPSPRKAVLADPRDRAVQREVEEVDLPEPASLLELAAMPVEPTGGLPSPEPLPACEETESAHWESGPTAAATQNWGFVAKLFIFCQKWLCNGQRLLAIQKCISMKYRLMLIKFMSTPSNKDIANDENVLLWCERMCFGQQYRTFFRNLSRARIQRAGDEWFDVLGLEKQASKQEVKNAFKRLLLLHHPDKDKSNTGSTYKKVRQAYKKGLCEVLRRRQGHTVALRAATSRT